MDWYALVPLSAFGAWVLSVVITTPFETRRNDVSIRRRDADLAKRLEDDDRQLRIELKRLTNSMASDGQLYSGALVSARQAARDHVLSRWEDQLRDAARDFEDVELSERWWHGAWRQMTSRPLPHLQTPDAQATRTVLTRWQVPEQGAAMSEPERGIHPSSVKPVPLPEGPDSPTGPFRTRD